MDLDSPQDRLDSSISFIVPARVGQSVIVEVPSDDRVWNDWPSHVAAVEFFTDDGIRHVGVWAFEPRGLFIAVDGTAREFSSLGAAAKGNSTMGKARDAAAQLPQVTEARQRLDP